MNILTADFYSYRLLQKRMPRITVTHGT